MSYATSALSSICDRLVVAIVVAAGPDSLPAPRCRLPTPARAAIEADAGHEWHRREGEAAMMEPIEAGEREPVEARRKSWPDREAARPDKPAAEASTHRRATEASTHRRAAETAARYSAAKATTPSVEAATPPAEAATPPPGAATP